MAAGLHGANRLGGNSLSDIIVFGKRAGEGAAAFAKPRARARLTTAQIDEEIDTAPVPLGEQSGGENPYTLTQELQEAMQKNAMIARTEEGLLHVPGEDSGAAEARSRTSARRRRPLLQSGLARRPRHPLHAEHSEVIVRCALERKESRGAQWRLDFPDPDADWGKKNLIATKDADGSVQITTRPLPEMPPS